MPTTTTVLPTASYGPGSFSFGPVVIPTGVTGVTARIARASLSSVTLTINWALELSQDGGTTWLSWGSAGTSGGVLIDEFTGNPYVFSTFLVSLPNPTNALRRLRGSVALNEAATSSVSIITTP